MCVLCLLPAPPGIPWTSLAIPPASLEFWTPSTWELCWATPASPTMQPGYWRSLGSASAPGHCTYLHLIKASCEESKLLQSSACWLQASNLSISLSIGNFFYNSYSFLLKDEDWIGITFICISPYVNEGSIPFRFKRVRCKGRSH